MLYTIGAIFSSYGCSVWCAMATELGVLKIRGEVRALEPQQNGQRRLPQLTNAQAKAIHTDDNTTSLTARTAAASLWSQSASSLLIRPPFGGVAELSTTGGPRPSP